MSTRKLPRLDKTCCSKKATWADASMRAAWCPPSSKSRTRTKVGGGNVITVTGYRLQCYQHRVRSKRFFNDWPPFVFRRHSGRRRHQPVVGRTVRRPARRIRRPVRPVHSQRYVFRRLRTLVANKSFGPLTRNDRGRGFHDRSMLIACIGENRARHQTWPIKRRWQRIDFQKCVTRLFGTLNFSSRIIRRERDLKPCTSRESKSFSPYIIWISTRREMIKRHD